MMKTLRTFAVVFAALLSMNAMADTTVVGNEDNTTAWWSAFSDYYTIKPNETLSLEFTNYTDGAEYFHNWLAVVTTDADRGADGYSEYFVLRADNYGWGQGLNTKDNKQWYYYLKSNFNWDTFKTDMNGATIKMTIKRQDDRVTLHADYKTTGGAEYFEEFAMTVANESAIRAFISVEGGHLVIDNEKTTITDSEAFVAPAVTEASGTLVGLEDNTTAWWSAFSDYYTIEPEQEETIEFYNYSNLAENWFNYLFALCTDADRGTDNYAEYAVVRADFWGWSPTGDVTDNTWYTSRSNNFDWGNFKYELNGADVKLNIKREGAKVTARADYNGAETGRPFYQDFVINCGDGTQNIRVFLTTQNGHLRIVNKTPTAISSVAAERNDNVVYNLRGQRVEKATKGLYIVNGKKVIMK